MSHSPPVPAGNQSPYPSQEPPHVHQPKRDVPVVAPSGTSVSLGTALVIGAGAVIAGAAAFFFLRESAPKRPKPKARRRRKG